MKIKKKVGEKSVKLRKSVTAENLTQCIKKKNESDSSFKSGSIKHG